MEVTFTARGPAEIQRYLDVKAQELDQLSKRLQDAHNVLEDAELAWDEHYDEVMEQLEDDVETGVRKTIPGEDVRLSVARRTGAGRDLWNVYRKATRTVKRIEKECSQAGTVISACQTEAKMLTTELRSS